MQIWRTKPAMVLAAAVSMVACGSSTSPSGGSTSTAGLVAAFTAAPELAESFGGGAIAIPFLLGGITSTGTLGGAGGTAPSIAAELAAGQMAAAMAAYDAVGVESTVTFALRGVPSATVSSDNIIGYAGLTSTGVTTFVSGGVGLVGSTVPATGTYTGNAVNGAVTGTYATRSGSTYTTYLAQSRSVDTFTLTSRSFGSSSACPNANSVPGYTITCTIATGTLSGSFAFEAPQFSRGGTGTAIWTQPTTTFSALPAVKVVLSITQN